MKIIDVQGILMSCPLPEPLKLPFYGGERTILKRDAMLIRVKADNGLVGYAPGPAHERAAREIQNVIRPFLLGKDPRRWSEFEIAELCRSRRQEAHFISGGESQSLLTSAATGQDEELAKTYRAVEIALIDLAARYEGCALSELIGGRKRNRIKLYGSAGMYMSPARFAEEAAAIAGMGFTAYKMRPALGPERDLETVRLMREEVGPDMGLMIDAHSWWRMGDRSYSAETVAELAGAMAEFHPTWLEEPLPPSDHAAYRTLRGAKLVPIATGEHEQDEAGFLDLIETGAADYIQMDVCCQGGFAMGQRIFAAVARRGLRFAFHSWGTTLEVLAAAHLAICWPADVVEWLEYPCHSNAGRPGMYPFPLADEILREPLAIEHGDLIVPTGPGLGVEIDERVIEKYPFIPGPWSFFRVDSPPETVAVTGDHSVKWVAAAPPIKQRLTLIKTSMSAPNQSERDTGAREFSTTHWSVVLSAGRDNSARASEALAKLCRAYWWPLYAFVRRQGHSPHDAQDLTQEFFARLLEKDYLGAVDRSKGKFRSFLLAALEHFLANEWRNAHAQKRGGKFAFVSTDAESAEGQYLQVPAVNLSPQQLFEQQWAMTLLEQTLARLQGEFIASGKGVLFGELKIFLTGEKRAASYAELATKLGITEAALKMAVSRMRHRYGELLRAEIANTVASPGEIDEELRTLFAALS